MRCINGTVQKLISCVNRKAVKSLLNVFIPLTNLLSFSIQLLPYYLFDTIRSKLCSHCTKGNSNLYKCQPQELTRDNISYVLQFYVYIADHSTTCNSNVWLYAFIHLLSFTRCAVLRARTHTLYTYISINKDGYKWDCKYIYINYICNGH